MKKIFVLIVSTFLFSQSYAATYGSPVKENIKQGEQIKSMTMLITNYDDFKKEWDSTSFEHKPHAKVTNKAKIGDTVNLVIFFSNCLPDQESNCNVSFKARLFKGDKLIYETPKKEQQAPFMEDTILQLSNMTLETKFEDNDEGQYRYNVEVTDENADDTVVLSTYISVTK